MPARFLKPTLAALACAAVVIAVVPFIAQAATISSTLSLTGLSGQSSVTNTFHASSFSIGIENVTGTTSGGGAGAGKAVFHPVVVKHELKPAEASILAAAAQGRHLPEAELIVRSGDAELMRVSLVDVGIAEATVSGKSGQPEVALSYRQITVRVKDASFCWDVTANAGC